MNIISDTEYYFDVETGNEIAINGNCWESPKTGDYGLFDRSNGTAHNYKTNEDYVFTGSTWQSSSGASGLHNLEQVGGYQSNNNTNATAYRKPDSSSPNATSIKETIKAIETLNDNKPYSKTREVLKWIFVKVPFLIMFLIVAIIFGGTIISSLF